MVILRIEHPVPDFTAWKMAFDADPIGLTAMGVRRYRVLRPEGDPNFAAVDLDFDSLREAEACLAALRTLWRDVQGTVMHEPAVRILETGRRRRSLNR